MLHHPVLIKPCAAFWDEAARTLLKSERLHGGIAPTADLSAVRVVVPTFAHAQQLKSALAARMARTFIPPRITTLTAWLALQPPITPPASDAQRLMALYAELRQHAWLKKLFTARRNTDLLPLAQMLLTLCDELTQALLPAIQRAPATAEARWQAALEQLAPTARSLLSDEAQLVWTIWKTQLDGTDPHALRFAQMMRLAEHADAPLAWISPVAPDAFETAFLDAYGSRQPVQPIMLDWRARSVDPPYAHAWPELLEDTADAPTASDGATPARLALFPAKSLEDEAQRGAQTVLDWLAAGMSQVAIIAQDRVVARRIRALLERAHVFVADETGWKLSTTRAAASIAAWFEVVAARAETVALLDLLKSPFLPVDEGSKYMRVMAIELALRRANVSSGWTAIDAALEDLPTERRWIARIAALANTFASGRKTLAQWTATTSATLDALGMRKTLATDGAGAQVMALLDGVTHDCATLEQVFSFAEWRAFVSLQLESAPFTLPASDRRVVMLPLNGARLRSFDAVLTIGADADHLPSKPAETLFFANAVRRELGLATRESRQRQQLRDFTALLQSGAQVVLSWQAYRNGEPNPVSPWIARLQLMLERSGAAPLAEHRTALPVKALTPRPAPMPRPSAAALRPTRLSASGYNSLVACPYQFFVTRMLGLSGIDELSELPEKRDYGDWLHQILKQYHDTVRDRQVKMAEREALLMTISEAIFEKELAKNAAALGYYVRWKKAAPAYLTWANEREASGWYFAIGEQWHEKPLALLTGQMTLQGRIDRIDVNQAGERAVLDYKTKNQQALNNRLRQREDHQLAFYGLLSENPVAYAHYVALDPVKQKTGDAQAPCYDQWQQGLAEQIARNMQAIAEGAPLQASGIETVCQYCDVRGLCRKGAW